MSANVNPYCPALVVCDHVHRDGGSGKHSLIGLFSEARPQTIPTPPIPIGVFATLAGGRGECHAVVRLLHSSDYDSGENHLFKADVELKFSNPMKPVELGFNVVTVFPKSGVYFLQLFANDELLMEKTIRIFEPPATEVKE